MTRIGVVLGGGGSVGVAFHGGVLAALEEATGWDPRTAEVVVGTSAGSLSAALLRCGLPASDLRAVSEDTAMSPEGALLAEVGQPHRPRSHLTDFVGVRPMAEPGAVLRGLVRPWRTRPMAWISALLPEGPVSGESIAEGLDEVTGGRWPSAALWVTTVRLRDGRRVVFGRDGAPEARLGPAVSASCAIPGYFRPVRIGGDRFVDGGVASMHNLDLLADRGLDLVIVSAPMSFAGIRPPLSPDVVLRQSVRLQLAGEIAKLRRRGTKVVVVAPTGRVVTAMGVDAMDARRRGAVSRAAHRTTLDVVARRRLRVLLADAAGAPRSAAGHHPAA